MKAVLAKEGRKIFEQIKNETIWELTNLEASFVRNHGQALISNLGWASQSLVTDRQRSKMGAV